MASNTRRLRSGLAVAGIVTAVAAPAAWAGPVERVDRDGSGYERPLSAYYVQSPAPEPATSSSDGFDWGDAGIGATAILALAAIGAGATVAVGHRTRRRDHTVTYQGGRRSRRTHGVRIT
jgi:hypothetical protein